MEQITVQDYLRRLQTAMEEEERAEEEINACCAYTSRLYGKGLPVLFDGEQVKMVLRLKDLDWRQAYHSFFRVNPKFCVNSIWGANRAKFIQGGSRGIGLLPC